MSGTLTKVIVKIEKFNGETRPVIFLPNTPANAGLIAYCSPSEGHGEASMGYYLKCKPADKDTTEEVANWYANLGSEYMPIQIAKRQTPKDRTEAYDHI